MKEQLGESSRLALDPSLFDLQLIGVDGRMQTLSELMGKTATAVVFLGNGCPTARSYEDRLKGIVDTFGAGGVRLVAINSNNPSLSPPDTVDEMKKRAGQRAFNFPYLKDSNSELARGFGAVCTPHAFLLDANREIVYSGRIDDSRLGDRITERDLHNAIRDLVADKPPTVARTEPFGCSIVW
jgi:thiol-disulfide isomerase/thioredoxin